MEKRLFSQNDDAIKPHRIFGKGFESSSYTKTLPSPILFVDGWIAGGMGGK
jgi:hypothetical protein